MRLSVLVLSSPMCSLPSLAQDYVDREAVSALIEAAAAAAQAGDIAAEAASAPASEAPELRGALRAAITLQAVAMGAPRAAIARHHLRLHGGRLRRMLVACEVGVGSTGVMAPGIVWLLWTFSLATESSFGLCANAGTPMPPWISAAASVELAEPTAPSDAALPMGIQTALLRSLCGVEMTELFNRPATDRVAAEDLQLPAGSNHTHILIAMAKDRAMKFELAAVGEVVKVHCCLFSTDL